MAQKPTVLMIITLDTKEVEARFIRGVLESQGVDVIHMDCSIRRTVEGVAEIGPDAVAAAAGKTLQEIRDLRHEGKCQAEMTVGSTKLAQDLVRAGKVQGVIGLGGSMGTSLITAVMRALPYGLPKVMISTMASGMTRGFVGCKDITMINSVCDIAGLNSISRDVFRNGAVAVAAMAKSYAPGKPETAPLAVMSTLSVTDKCSIRVRNALTDAGYEVMVFHTTGTGGNAMDEIIAERDVSVVINLSLVEINDFLHGGLCSAGPERCKASLAKGIPTLFAPGNIDFIIAGPIDHAQANWPGRRYHVHNSALTAVRSGPDDFRRVAAHMAGLIDDATGPATFLVPLVGFSSHDSEQGYLHEPSMPPVFAAALKEKIRADVAVVEYPCHINDEMFADAITAWVLGQQQSGKRAARS
jgi:uncharacterized protein (UPF0261 family)